MKVSIYNIFFRGLSLFSKFVLILFLGKYSIDEQNLGVYGIMSTSIALLIYIIGFDFYIFNTREIIEDTEDRIGKVRAQLYFHVLTYLIIIPVSLISIFKFKFLPFDYIWIFLMLTVSEHLGQEAFRLFTTIKRSAIGNLLYFIRGGLWVWYILFDFFIIHNEIDLKKYFIIWLIFSWISFIVSFFVLKGYFKVKSYKLRGINWNWVKLGIKTSSIFFLGSLSFQVIQFSDRYMIDFFYGKKMVGVYTAYAQFTNAIEVFTFSAVTMITFPKLIEASKDIIKYKQEKAKFFKHLITITFILILIVVVIAPIIFEFLGKNSFKNNINSFYLLIISVFLLIMSNVYHYDLYVKRKDRLLMRISFFAMLLNVILNFVLIPKYEIYGAAVSTFVAFLIIFILKCFFSNKLK